MRTLKLITVTLLALVMASASSFAAGNKPNNSALGFIRTHGDVKVDHLPIPAETALFPGDRVSTGTASAAVLKLNWGASVVLGGNSSLQLSRDGALRQLDLNEGVAIVRSAGNRLTVVRVPGSEVRVGGGRFPSLCRIALLGDQANVFAQSGRVEVKDAGRSAVLVPGKWFRLNADPQAGVAGQKAGSVTAEIPTAVRHPVQTPKSSIPLKLRSEVNWQDLVQTTRTGRVRITLLDDSVLNVGADATMHIIEHRPQEQQTTVELTLGRMRAEVKKLTQPKAHFRVQTQTAVIGVVGTIFIVEALPNLTRVWCIQGVVEVHNIIGSVKGSTRLRPGQYTTVMPGLPPSAPMATPAAQLQSQVNLTNVASVPGAEVLPGVTETPISVTAVTSAAIAPGAGSSLALSGAELGVTGTAAVASGVAVSRAGSASNAANHAEANGLAAVTAADNAAQSASNAAIAAASAAATAQAAQAAASAALPTGCGCPP